MLNVHRSNRADRLIDHLAGRLAADPLADPMATERIAVQSRGMERWLSHQLAQRLGATAGDDGVCANIDFPFPGRVVREVMAACSDGADRDDPWEPDRLVWPVLEMLSGLEAPGAERIRSYLRGGEVVDRRRYGLARRIADLLDRYAMFRPRMVRAWSDGDDIDSDEDPLLRDQLWQPELWRALETRLDVPHLARRFDDAEQALRDPGATPEGLPPRLTLFGTSQLPPSYLDLLVALATRIEVSLYAIVPSPVLWDRVAAAGGSADVEARHPVLVSSGRLARDFQVLLERTEGYGGDGNFVDPAGSGDADDAVAGERADTALARLQSDLLRDIDRGDPTSDDPGLASVELSAGDTSIQFHVCHGPARQVEVLHDRLRHLFEDDPGLEPRDVLVMAPDIEAYAPLISAVFDRSDASTPIPFRLADRTLRRTNVVAAGLLSILDLIDSRVTASAVLDLLGSEPLRRRAGLDEQDLGRVQSWVGDSGIRWALDGAHREEHGQPGDREHTWRFGLDRLLLGVAMPDEDDRLYADVVPYDDMEGGDVALLGRFVAFCDRLFRTVEELREPRPIAAWADALVELVEELIEVGEGDRWFRDQTVDVIRALVDQSRGPTGEPSGQPLALDAVRSLLDRSVREHRPVAGYESGAVTFCEMIPMRSIPHRVICLLGMDDGEFPRPVRPLGFDLVADRPATGDRDRRDEDRLLLLEALLAARDHLLVLYTGRDQRTNEERAPAVPVGEIRDVLDRAHRPDGQGRPASERLTVEHPLQGFSPRNFVVREADDARTAVDAPLSFETDQLAAARTLLADETREWRFVPEPLPPVEDDDGVVELADLRRCLRDPIRWLCTRRLGMWLGEEEQLVEDTEPVQTDGLSRWRLGDSMLTAVLPELPEGTSSWDGRARWQATRMGRGDVPAGTLGRYEVERVRPSVDAILAAVRAVVDAERDGGSPGAHDVPIDVTVGDRTVRGVVRDVRDGVHLTARYARLKPAHRLMLWLDHLALAAGRREEPVRCVVIGRDRSGVLACSFDPLPADEARRHLSVLLDLYERAAEVPLPLFGSSSEAYAETMHAAVRGGVEEARLAAAEDGREPTEREVAGAVAAARHRAEPRALGRARDAWEPGYFGRGDSTDVHVVQCFGDGCSFDTIVAETDLAAVAEAVWFPILDAEVEL